LPESTHDLNIPESEASNAETEMFLAALSQRTGPGSSKSGYTKEDMDKVEITPELVEEIKKRGLWDKFVAMFSTVWEGVLLWLNWD